jgi:hypothetical protein
MPNLPSQYRETLRREFDAAVIQLDQSRPGSVLTTDFYRQHRRQRVRCRLSSAGGCLCCPGNSRNVSPMFPESAPMLPVERSLTSPPVCQ